MIFKAKSFLFLQGLATPFFSVLGSRLRRYGANVLRVNFCAGDHLWWHGPSRNFRGTLSQLPVFLESLFSEHSFTDVILFGDMRPIHQVAIHIARTKGAAIHVFEEGYIRPDWITVERGGVNANSPLPRDPNWYHEASSFVSIPRRTLPVKVPLPVRGIQDLAYRLANAFNAGLFPHYETHRPRHAFLEYFGWAKRYLRLPARKPDDARLIQEVLSHSGPVFFFPLQLNGDSQILHHSPFSNIDQAITQVVESFSRFAPPDALILIKNHPLDTGLDKPERSTFRVARGHGVEKRVHFIETGCISTILNEITGTVVVNSTVGLSSIWRGRPVCALANPIYKMPGLTFESTLDDFWKNPTEPCPQLFEAFRKTLLHVNHVNGDFFTPRGIYRAAAGCRRMLKELSPLEELLQKIPVERHGAAD